MGHRIFTTPFADVYTLYVAKMVRKGGSEHDLVEIIEWLTGFDRAALDRHLAARTTFEDFFADATLNPLASTITGKICGIRVEEIEDPLMQKVRYLDKLVDERANG
ncbi:MAG: hypothetical protein RI885_1839, partial [Actinomycetota bacterium]